MRRFVAAGLMAVTLSGCIYRYPNGTYIAGDRPVVVFKQCGDVKALNMLELHRADASDDGRAEPAVWTARLRQGGSGLLAIPLAASIDEYAVVGSPDLRPDVRYVATGYDQDDNRLGAASFRPMNLRRDAVLVFSDDAGGLVYEPMEWLSDRADCPGGFEAPAAVARWIFLAGLTISALVVLREILRRRRRRISGV